MGNRKLSLIRYRVDLRPYSGEAFERRVKRLEGYAFTSSFYADSPKEYEVSWEGKESIELVLDIPAHLVHRLGGST